LFVENPAGRSLHAFAHDGAAVVGHCSILPVAARLGERAIVSGKVEAFFVDERYRGARTGGRERALALDLLAAVSDLADEEGLDVLHAFVTPRVGALFELIGYRRMAVDARAYVLVSNPSALARRAASATRTAAMFGLFVTQNAVLSLAYAGAQLASGRSRRPRLEHPTAADAGLVTAEPPPTRWTISGSDSWDWYADSGLLRAVEVPGRYGCRAIIGLDDSHGEPLHLVAWRPARRGVLPALLLLGALGRIARGTSAPMVRFLPWPAKEGNGALERACRLVGFVPRGDLSLYVRWPDSAFAGIEVQLTPFFYLTY
jgi:hypothetical protein